MGWIALTHGEMSESRPTAQLDDEVSLIHAAQADPAAFDALYRRYVERVYRYVRAHAPSDEDAADITQQVFLQALRALPRYRPTGAPFAVWLFRIARHITTDAYRRARPMAALDIIPEASLPRSADEPEAAAVHREELSRLSALLGQLDPAHRELLALRFAAGLNATEIAAIVGKQPDAVRKHLSRIVHQLEERYHDA